MQLDSALGHENAVKLLFFISVDHTSTLCRGQGGGGKTRVK